MPHNIPKISYGSTIVTDIVFPYPPKFSPETLTPVDHTTFSIAGVRQTAIDRVEVTRDIEFSFVSEELLAALTLFHTSWAYDGSPFKYFEDQNSMVFTNYELGKLPFVPKMTTPVGMNAYIYTLTLSVRRVLDLESEDGVIVDIANNQAVAADITGLVLDHTKYRSIKIFFEAWRRTDTTNIIVNGYVTAVYNTDTNVWDITSPGVYDGETDPGLAYSMNGEQVQYTSSNMAGANYDGEFKFVAFVF